MMSGNQVDFGDAANVVDWNAHNQSQSEPYQNNQSADSIDSTYKNVTYGGTKVPQKNDESLIKHFLSGTIGAAQDIGKLLPNPLGDYWDTYEELGKKAPVPRPSEIDVHKAMGLPKPEPWSKQDFAEIAGGLALPLPPLAKGIKSTGEAIKSAVEYLKPEKKAQELISSLGEGTSKDVIEEIGKRLQFGKNSALSESLIPKKELFDKFGEEKLFYPKLKYAESNIYEAPESKYLSQKNVTDPYSSNGKLQSLHDTFENNPTLNNYDALQSSIKNELRIQEKSAKRGSDIASQKVDQLKNNIKNLDADAKNVISKLPDEYKNLELEWRKKYATSVPKYEESSKAIDKLSSGNWQEVNADQTIKSFIYDNKKTREVLKDIGPSATKNFLYLALQKTGAEDAEALGKKILELKNTKGFDKFIDKDLEAQANRLIKQNKRANLIKKAIKVSGGATAGGLIGGPIGAVTGAALPFGKDAFNLALKKYRK